MKVLVVGANNSGKGTLVKLLKEKTDLTVIGCSNVLNQKGLDINTGKLLPDDDVNIVMKEYLSSKDDFILDGYPRTLNQDNFMQANLFKPDLIIVLNIFEEDVLYRAVGRRICPKCGEVYNLNGYRLPQKEGFCDKCKELLIQREDDKEETVKRRFQEYLEKTYPVVMKYKNINGELVWEFNAISDDYNKISDTIAEYINYILY